MRNFGQIFLYLFLFTLVFYSCDDFDDVSPQTDDEYFVTKEKLTTYSIIQINAIINVASNLYPKLAEISDKFTSGVEVYKLTYKTTFNGKKRLASGLVCLPTQAGIYPIMSFQNGTNTLHSAAPSVDYNNELFKVLEITASTGFVVVIPDYLGFGEADDMFHPYLHKESTVQTVLDMLKAVEEMMDKQESIILNNDLYITGYSQGGWATMAVQEAIDKHYSNEFNLKGSACGGGPHNLVGFSEFLLSKTDYPMPYFPAYLYNSYLNLDMATPIASIFQEPYAGKIPTLFDGTKDGGQLNAQLTTSINDLFTPNLIENWDKGGIYESLYSMLQENSISGYSTSTPTLLIHGDADTFVPASLSESLRDEFIDAGVSSELINLTLLPGLGHTDAIVPAELASIIWFIELRDSEI